jgi:RNA polymerase sigma factor (sigma-70 family)
MKLRQLIDKHYRSGELYSIAFKMTNQKDLAEDLLHSAIAKMIRYDDFENRNFLGYAKVTMFRINSNINRDSFSRSRKRAIYAERLLKTQDIENDLHYKDIYNQILDSLDEKYKSIFIHKMLQYTSKEISEEIGIIENCINGRYYRVRQEVINKFKESI